jgi:hypothetical protein
MAELFIDLDQRNDLRLYAYQRMGDNVSCVLQGVSPALKGNFQVVLDSNLTQQQTVILARGVEYEIVLELRPRRLSPTEKAKLSGRT